MSDEIERTQRIGRRIRERRLELGLSQSALAGRLGVTMQSVSLWENGKTMIGSNGLLELAKELQCDIYWLLGDPGEKQRQQKPIENEGKSIKEVQFYPFKHEIDTDGLPKPAKSELDLLKRVYLELDRPRKLNLLRKAIELWKESVSETLKKYEDELSKDD